MSPLPSVLIVAALAAGLAMPVRADMSETDTTPISIPRLEDLRPAERPPASTDEAGIWLMADQVERQVKTSGTLVRDPVVNAYVRSVVCKLAGPHCADMRVYVVRRAGFNATMMPNGTMSVWTGLLARCENEAQLAAVLGHEIGHYLRRHSIQAQRDARDKLGAGLLFSVAFGMVGIPAGGLISLAVTGSIYSFSRDNEREADAIGARLMAQAGYDVREAAALWRNIDDERKGDDARESQSIFFATHPEPEERRTTLSRLAQELNSPSPHAGRGELQRIVSPNRLSYLRDELNLRHYVPFANLLARIEKDDYALGEIHYMRGEMLRMRAKDDDNRKAVESYRAALGFAGTPPELHRSLALVQARLGDKGDARASFSKYLELTPNAEDREMIQMMMQTAD